MDGSFSLMPPSGAPEGSEAFARELAAFVAPYLEEHADVCAGVWLDSVGSGIIAPFVAFTDDLLPHRAALDHRVQVMSARFTAADLESVRDEARAFVQRYDGARFRDEWIDEATNRVVVSVETVEADALREAMTERFSGMVGLRVETFVTALASFEAWSLEGDELTVHWMGGAGERNHRLEIQEAERFVRVAVLLERFDGAAGSTGIDMNASGSLSEPLGDRLVIDGTTGQRRQRYASPTAMVFGDDDADWEEVEPPLPEGPITQDQMHASAIRAAHLGDQARAYVREHAFVFGGMWTESHAGGVLLCVAFSEDARGHRAALDPAIKVLRCEYPIAELEQMQRDVTAMIKDAPGTEWSSSVLTVSEGTIDVFASAEDLPDLARTLAGRFGACVRLVPLDSPTHVPTETAFDAWMGDDDSQFLAIVWSEAAGGPAFLLLDEQPDAVYVTVIESRPLPGTRPQSIQGRRAVASAHLRRPLAGRMIIDATSGEERPRFELQGAATSDAG